MSKYLDSSGLSLVWSRLKGYLSARIGYKASSNNTVVEISNIDASTTSITKTTYEVPTTDYASFGYANSALQSISSSSQSQLTVSSKGGDDGLKTLAITVLTTTPVYSSTGGTPDISVASADTNKLLTGTAITPIKQYVDAKFGAITSITYSAVDSQGNPWTYETLPDPGTEGVIYLIKNTRYDVIDPSAQTPPVTNPHDAGYYVESGGTYTLTEDTTVVDGHTYYLKTEAYDEYIYVTALGKYEKLGSAALDLGDYLKKVDYMSLAEIVDATPYV